LGIRGVAYNIGLLIPVLAVAGLTSIGPCFTTDVITFDQNWQYLYSSSARGKDLSNDAMLSAA